MQEIGTSIAAVSQPSRLVRYARETSDEACRDTAREYEPAEHDANPSPRREPPARAEPAAPALPGGERPRQRRHDALGHRPRVERVCVSALLDLRARRRIERGQPEPDAVQVVRPSDCDRSPRQVHDRSLDEPRALTDHEAADEDLEAMLARPALASAREDDRLCGRPPHVRRGSATGSDNASDADDCDASTGHERT